MTTAQPSNPPPEPREAAERTVAVLQASLVDLPPPPPSALTPRPLRGAARLRGRLLRPLGGQAVITQLARRLRCAASVTDVVVAISVAPEDDGLLAPIRAAGARVFRGAVHDQAARLSGCLDWLGVGDDAVVVRVPGDHPLIDWGYVDAGVRALRKQGAGVLEFLEDQAEELCGGLSAAFLTAGAARLIDGVATQAEHRTDPMLYALENPAQVRLARAALPEAQEDLRGDYRLLLQTAEDLAVHEAIYLRLYDGQPIPTAQAIAFLDQDPVVASLNRGVLCRGDARTSTVAGWRAR